MTFVRTTFVRMRHLSEFFGDICQKRHLSEWTFVRNDICQNETFVRNNICQNETFVRNNICQNGQRPTQAPKGPLTRSNFGQSQNNLAQRASQGVYKWTCSKTRPCKSVWQYHRGFKMPINLLDPLGGPSGQIVLALTKIGPCQWPLRGLGGPLTKNKTIKRHAQFILDSIFL